MGSRRLNDRILGLCEQAIITPAGSELNQIFRELHAALGEHNSRLRNTALTPVPNRQSDHKAECSNRPHCRVANANASYKLKEQS